MADMFNWHEWLWLECGVDPKIFFVFCTVLFWLFVSGGSMTIVDVLLSSFFVSREFDMI